VVDWTDHVWNEVLVQGEWMHIDPCEAAVQPHNQFEPSLDALSLRSDVISSIKIHP